MTPQNSPNAKLPPRPNPQRPSPQQQQQPKVAARPRPRLSGAQLATAFDGNLERVRTTFGYRVGIVLVAFMMVLLPVVYVAIIALTAWLTMKWPGYASGMFRHARGRGAIVIVVVFITAILAGALLVISMILPMFWRSSRGPKPFWVDKKEEPLLYAFVEKLCAVTGAPKPARIDVIASPNASAHIDNGVFGLVHRRLVLTIGLPLVATMDLKQFTGVLAHELGHFTQGIFMRLSYAVQLINAWFARMAWGRSGIDDVLSSMLESESHWAIMLVAFCCKVVLFAARLVLMVMALISQALTMNLSRQAEFDADRRAARIVGSDPLGAGLQILPAVSVAGAIALEQAQEGWARRALPDDLVLLTAHRFKHLPQAMRDKLDAEILSEEDSWFDSHPPLFKRVAALKKANYAGVMKVNAPATELFQDFDELCKLTTIDLYASALGKELQPEYLVPTKLPKTMTVKTASV
jgi:Zn-dependent protease with chaperone function